jgi:hypothetical protein
MMLCVSCFLGNGEEDDNSRRTINAGVCETRFMTAELFYAPDVL